MITNEERTGHRIRIGFDPKKLISTVSWVCSECGKHIAKDQEVCHHCGVRLLGATPKSFILKGDTMEGLYCGDCQDVLFQTIKDCDNPIIVSDPPFNIGYKYDEYHDKMSEDDYYSFMGDIFGLCPSVIIHYPEALYKISSRMGIFPERVVSWVYNSNTARQHRDIAFFGVKPDFRKVRQPYKNLNDKRIQKRIAEGKTGAKLYDWWNVNQVKNVSKDKTKHPCQMPLEVMTNIIGILPEDATIVDPFMGSGTTGVACKKLGRKFVGIEMSPNYFEIAKSRIEETA